VQIRKRWVARLGTVAVVGGLLATIGLSGTSSASSPLGTPHKATGKPINVGMIDLIGAPVSFPEAYQAAVAAIDYVNNYEDGINNRPLKLYECSNTTLAPPASTTCANTLIGDHLTFVLGAADTGAAGAFPIWEAHHLAYIGGSPFTPVESNAPNAAIFASLNVADNAGALAYAAHTLHIKSVGIIEAADAQGEATGALLDSVAKSLGMTDTVTPLSDTASTSDFAAAAASAEAGSPGLIYVEAPTLCVQMLQAIHQTGYTGKLAGIDPCASPPAIASEAGAGNGLIFASPYVGFDRANTKQWASEIKLTEAILAKYAPKTIALDAPAFEDFGAVMNLHTTLDKIKGKLTESSILGALRKPGNHPNWLAHPYDCATHLVPSQSAVCEPYQQIFEIKNGKVVTLSTAWVDGAKYYTPPSS
jgi:branched-chain amino acid transport system substrate-binding protein